MAVLRPGPAFGATIGTLLLAAGLPALAPAADTTPPEPADLGHLFTRLLSEHDVPGGVFAVLRTDGSTEVHATGLRRLGSPHPVEPTDCFYIGSLTKTYVSTVALQLVDEERLDLDATVDRYLAGIPRGDVITIRQLLNHTSGIEDAYTHLYYQPLEQMLADLARPWTPEKLLTLGLGLPPRFEPGTDYYYAGTNYDLLAAVIERLTGASLEEALSRRIFEPLDLERTWMGLGRSPPACLVTGHLAPTEFWEHSETLYPELAPSTDLDEPMIAWAAGGLGSTAREMIAFGEALFSGRLMSERSFREMSTFLSPREPSRLSRDPDGFGYGLGLIHGPRATYRRIGHGGMYSGYTVGLWNVPEAGSIVALLLNRGLFFEEREILDRLVEALMSRMEAHGDQGRAGGASDSQDSTRPRTSAGANADRALV